MILNFKKTIISEDIKIPGNKGLDAGFDLYSPIDIDIKRKRNGFIDTGIAVQATKIPSGWKFEGKIEGTSGNAKKKGLHPIGGVVDQGYTGSIGVVLVNSSWKTIHIKKGDKIAQLVPMLIPVIEKVNLVEEFTNENNDDRGTKGFGSTGIAGEKKTRKPKSSKSGKPSANKAPKGNTESK